MSEIVKVNKFVKKPNRDRAIIHESCVVPRDEKLGRVYPLFRVQLCNRCNLPIDDSGWVVFTN